MQSRRISHKQDLSPWQIFQQFALSSPSNSVSFYCGHYLNESGYMIPLGFHNWT
jgi:hypothetical protein